MGWKGENMSIAGMIEKYLSAVKDEDPSISGIEDTARKLDIDIENMDKIEIIHAIQQAQGIEPCFGTAEGYCCRTDCCFLEDCLQVSK
jgi:hypothetical protein